MADPNLRDDVIADIENHLAMYGSANWAVVRVRWPQVSDATWWRYVAAAKSKIVQAQILEESRRKLAERAAATTPAEKAAVVGANLPVAPPPDFIAKNGEGGIVHLNLLEKFEELYTDAVKLRDFALTPEGRVNNPLYFGQSIGLRDRLLETALRSAEAVWNLRRQQEFYELVINEIAAASPEVAQTIMERLRDLNQRTGMSFDARV